ncbi:MAG: hypothetical protein AAF849_14490 [Bacteroidota bacterium]
MSKKKEIQNELEELAPELLKIEETGFEVPDNYFELLSDTVFKRIESTAAPETSSVNTIFDFGSWIHQIRSLFQPQYALALLGIALLLIGIFALMPSQKIASDATANRDIALEDEEILQYVEENIEDFDESLLLSSLESQEEEYLEILLEEASLEELF